MPIDAPVSDTSRGIQHDSDQTWPSLVKIAVHWEDAHGRVAIRTEIISADAFFGRGQYGAPMEGAHLINAIERMRRAGPPKVRRGRR